MSDAIKKAKIPECLRLEANNTCSLKMLGAASSPDGKAVRLDVYDKQDQHFPISMSAQDLCDLLLVVGIMSQEMEAKQKASGSEPQIQVLRGRNGQDLPPLRFRMSWSPEKQKMQFILGNAGLEFPMDADTAMTIGKGLLDKASRYSSGPTKAKH
jgi:hypothetical protein